MDEDEHAGIIMTTKLADATRSAALAIGNFIDVLIKSRYFHVNENRHPNEGGIVLTLSYATCLLFEEFTRDKYKFNKPEHDAAKEIAKVVVKRIQEEDAIAHLIKDIRDGTDELSGASKGTSEDGGNSNTGKPFEIDISSLFGGSSETLPPSGSNGDCDT